ncbi:hypothetical protein [Novosphingobium sp. JCM 18896]|uniref:hypothetical protein n=1 Tax=Novosphingobium sp. JCM 18896 TaxID=2989731 RepID=UPI002222430B|nr:hypothetical protein [Novosphingobium sp. JCM 18896]MCW1429912.1 hypothetical protein [Novosphingobium sp. JCM 18896]
METPGRLLRIGLFGSALAAVFALGAVAPTWLRAPADAAAPRPQPLPTPPPGGVMGFVVDSFVQPVIQGKDACPQGTALKLRDAYLATLPAEERAQLERKENEAQLTQRWHAYAFGPDNTNVCSQPDMFERPLLRTVQSKKAWGLDLDEGKTDDTCAHEAFTTPTGEQGIDNQEYRAMGCTLEWRGVDGIAGDNQTGMRQFMSSGEWTQVILLRGVDSLQNDDDVEVIYANTPDRPLADSKGQFLRGTTFTISDKAPRNRNVLHGRIKNGVLTTDPADIVLTQTWGQGGARDIRGNRTKWHYAKGRLRLAFQPDGSLRGVMGGYRPIFDVIVSPAIGGAGSAIVAGIDCAQNLATLRHYADGLKNPKTGKCEGVSAAQAITAIPAFVNDVAPARTAAR